MRVRYSFSSRRTGHIDKMRKQREKYPKLLLRVIEISDIILEILDARFIEKTRNKEIENLIRSKGKEIIYVFNKSDMIDVEKAKYDPRIKTLTPYVFVSATKRLGGKDLREKIKYFAKKVKKDESMTYDRVQVGVIGYPNAGKSSIINLLIGKTSAPTGAQAGFTKGLQKLKLSKNILLLDSPGVIPKKEYSEDEQEKTSKNALVGARDYHKVKDPEIVVFNIMSEYDKEFRKHYKLNKDETAEDLIEKIGKEKNFLKRGGVVDTDRSAREIIREWQEGKIQVR